jgi:RimJ/RimL family protein N-acetyltransferase
MQLKPLSSPEDFRLVAGWLADKANYQWLDFGDGRQLVNPEWLKIAQQRGSHVLRLFTADDEETPVGVVGLSNLNRQFRSANVWVVLGDKTCAGRGYASRATSKMLTLGFSELALHSIQTWIVEHNPSIRVAARVKFRPIGRQRECHYIDGRWYDRLWFDLLASEHEEIDDGTSYARAGADRGAVFGSPERRHPGV